MPIIINGGSYSDGGWWSKHLQKAETNERVEVVGFDDLSAETIPDAFREMEALASATRCKNYFYQDNINPRADEHLTPAQRDEAIDTLGRISASPASRALWSSTRRKARTHWHVVWSRIDTEKMQAISDSLTAAIHERTSRELEIKFDLERGQSVLVPNRDMSGPSAARRKMKRSAPPKPALTSRPSKPTPRPRGSGPTTGRVSGRRLRRPAIMCWRAATGAILSSLTAPATITAWRGGLA